MTTLGRVGNRSRGVRTRRAAHVAFAIAASLVLLGVFVVSMRTVSADNPETGIRLNLVAPCLSGVDTFTPPATFSASTTFPQGTDFFVKHGWDEPNWNDSTIVTAAKRAGFLHNSTTFFLFVDSVPVASQPNFFVAPAGSPATPTFFKFFLSDFPGGMTGTHLFTGEWFLDGSLAGGTFGQSVFQLRCDVTVTFV